MSDLSAGLRLALTTFSVLPLRPGRVDRAAAAWAMALAPLVGAALGVLLAVALAGFTLVGTPPLLAGMLALGALALATRGLHLDGLADTADGLGCHGPPARALEVMRAPANGAFAVVTLVLFLGAQAAALAALATHQRWLGGVVAIAAGRLAIVWSCRRGVPAARPDGLGALAAGTVPAAAAAGWTLLLAAAAVPAVAGRPWQGPLAVLGATAASVALTWHVTRRFGGVTGDTLGASCEAAALVALAVLASG